MPTDGFKKTKPWKGDPNLNTHAMQIAQADILHWEEQVADLETQVASLQAKIDSAIIDLHEIQKVGRNPAAGLARDIIVKLR